MRQRLAIQRIILNQILLIWALSWLDSGLAMRRGLAMELRFALQKAMVNLGLAIGALSKEVTRMTVQGVELMIVQGLEGRQEEVAKYKEPTRGEL
jgi:hypothetical protein